MACGGGGGVVISALNVSLLPPAGASVWEADSRAGGGAADRGEPAGEVHAGSRVASRRQQQVGFPCTESQIIDVILLQKIDCEGSPRPGRSLVSLSIEHRKNTQHALVFPLAHKHRFVSFKRSAWSGTWSPGLGPTAESNLQPVSHYPSWQTWRLWGRERAAAFVCSCLKSGAYCLKEETTWIPSGWICLGFNSLTGSPLQ